MSKKVFVGGLSWDTDDNSLRAAFEQFGEVVEAKVICDQYTGRSRGFGFVTFVDGAAMSEAIEVMDGRELDGRTIRVSEARQRPSGGAGGAPRRDQFGGGGGRPPRRRDEY